MLRELVLTVGLLITTVSAVLAQEKPCVYPRMDQVNAHVRARVTRSSTGFDYHFAVENRPGASQVLDSFAIQAFPAGVVPTQISPEIGGPEARLPTPSSSRGTWWGEPVGLHPARQQRDLDLQVRASLQLSRFWHGAMSNLPAFRKGRRHRPALTLMSLKIALKAQQSVPNHPRSPSSPSSS